MSTGNRAELSTFWKRRMTMLPRIARLKPGLSPRGRSSLLICGLALFALPTWFATAQSQDVTAAGKSSSAVVPRATPTAVASSPFAAPLTEFLPPLSDAEQAIVRELDLPTSFDFQDESLEGVRTALMERHKFNIIYDPQASLDAESEGKESIAESTDLTLRVNNIPLRSALRLLFAKKGLAFYVEDDVLKITEDTGHEPGGSTRTYPVRDLVGVDESDYQRLMEAIKEGVAPWSWKGTSHSWSIETGADWSTISKVPATGCLVIRTTWRGHDEVLALLRTLRKANLASPKK
jgi:hypothetical protein